MFKLILPMLSLLLINQNTTSKWTGTSMFILALGTYSLMFVFQPLISHFSPTEFFSISNISAPLISLTIWISALMIIASFKTLHTTQSPSTFSFNVVILCLILTLTFSVNSLPLFYISFEASLIPTLILILGWGYQPERLQASMYLMLYTITASLPLLLAICISHASNNHSSFLLPSIAPLQNSAGAIWWFACMAAFLVKMPMYTTHLWLPKAHVEAPVAGSMILAGILLKLGGYGLMQMMMMFPSQSSFLPSLVVAISMWGAVATAMICLRQTDMKSLIAYSSVGHMGLLTSGLMSNSTWGWNGAMIMMLAHGLCSPAMFALANMTYEATKTRSMYLSKGLLMLFPSLSFWWFIMSAANMAAPPSINLFGEIVLFPSILAQAPQMGLLLAISTFLAGAYSLFLYTSSQHGAPPSFSNPTHLFTTRNYYVVLLHAFPLFLLILKAELVTLF